MPESILWPGNRGPATSPRRRPRSVRRTTTIDGHRPDGPLGDVVRTGLGRDLVTGVPLSEADDACPVTVVAAQRLDVRADFVTDQAIRSISADPAEGALDQLVGVASRSGLRRAIRAAVPERTSTSGPVERQNAVASAERLVGMAPEDVLAYVRAKMSGATTCTHLNDHLRALGDVHALRLLLPS